MTTRLHLTGPLDPSAGSEVRRLAAVAAEHDGVEPLGEQTLLDLSVAGTEHVLASDGPLVGVAQIGPLRGATRTAELVVAPDARGAGLGGRLLAAALERAGPQVRLWAHGSLPAASLLARRAGLVPVRELWRMGRDLTGPLPEAELPPGTLLRGYEPDRDAQAWLAVNRAAFADHPEQGRMTLADLRARQAEPWFVAPDLLLAERDDALVGFAWTKLTGAEGELYVLGVAPEAQRTGLGRALTAAALTHLRDRGARRAVLFTDADNARAVRTYATAGFTVDRADTQFAVPGIASPHRQVGDATMSP